MSRRVSWINNSFGHSGTYVYRSPTLDPQNLPAPVATVNPVDKGETAEWIDNDDLSPGDYDYAVRDFYSQENGALSTVNTFSVIEDYSSSQVGDYVGGGVYAGVDAIGGTNYHIIAGLAVSEEYGLQWKTSQTETPGTLSDEDGLANTNAMISAGISDHPAAQHCVNYSNEGFEGWHMPARNQLALIYTNLSGHSEFATNVSSGDYTWTSTERSAADPTRAKMIKLSDGTENVTSKVATTIRVRPIRRVPV